MTLSNSTFPSILCTPIDTASSSPAFVFLLLLVLRVVVTRVTSRLRRGKEEGQEEEEEEEKTPRPLPPRGRRNTPSSGAIVSTSQ